MLQEKLNYKFMESDTFKLKLDANFNMAYNVVALGEGGG